MGAPSGPFASAGTHKSSLVRTASASSAYHSIATGKRTLRQVRVAPGPVIGRLAGRQPLP
jgi:hypothetical protein